MEVTQEPFFIGPCPFNGKTLTTCHRHLASRSGFKNGIKVQCTLCYNYENAESAKLREL